MDILLRPEQPSDYYDTENITREAFWNHYVPGCSEHYLIHIMRSCPDFIAELDIVAVHADKIVGNVVYVKSAIMGDDGKNYEILTLGPISVLPAYQGKGIGGKLIKHTRWIAQELGFRAILLCGDPAYYSQQGFISAEQLGIRMADNMYFVPLQACELYENALVSAKGKYIENAIYELDETAAAEFDENFPKKDKITGTPSQKRFEEFTSMKKECY